MSQPECVVYFHGVPGSPRELEMFDASATAGWHAPDRRVLNQRVRLARHFDLLACDLRQRCSGRTRLVGFSLGAYVALEVASRLPDMPMTIDLVSAAAPLDGTDFLPRMAGKAIFGIARSQRPLFAALTLAQSVAARVAPAQLYNALFASAQGEDRGLRDDPRFRRTMASILQDCLAVDSHNYRREICGYVSDWRPVLNAVRQPVALWHGLDDNWCPPEMADALAGSLPNVTAVHRLPGKSHYSTLRAYMLQART